MNQIPMNNEHKAARWGLRAMAGALFCRRVGRTIAHCADPDEELPPRLQKHIAGCERCRARWDEQRHVANLLTRGATKVRHDAPAFLHRRIMAALQRADRTRPVELAPRWLLAVGAVAVVAMIWMALTMPRTPQRTPPVQSAAAHSALPPIGSVPPVDLERWSQRLEEPMAAEASAVVTDAKTALQLLAQNFVPAEWQGGMGLGERK